MNFYYSYLKSTEDVGSLSGACREIVGYLFLSEVPVWEIFSIVTGLVVCFFWGGRLRVPTRRCDLVVPVDWGWGRGN